MYSNDDSSVYWSAFHDGSLSNDRAEDIVWDQAKCEHTYVSADGAYLMRCTKCRDFYYRETFGYGR